MPYLTPEGQGSAAPHEPIVIADWDQLARAVARHAPGERVHPGKHSSSQFSRKWVTSNGMEFEIFVQWSAANATDFYRAPDPVTVSDLGDDAVFDRCHSQLIWRYRNINCILGTWPYKDLRPLADAIQRFIAAQPTRPASELAPRFRIDIDQPIELEVGESLSIEVDNLQPGDELLVDPFLPNSKNDSQNDSTRRFELTMTQPGEQLISLSTRNPTSLLMSPYIHVKVDCVFQRGVEIQKVQSFPLPHARLEPTGQLSHAPPHGRSHNVSVVFAVELGQLGIALIGFHGPTFTSAPLPMVMKLYEAVVLNASGQLVELAKYSIQPTWSMYGLEGVIVAFEREWRVEPAPFGRPPIRPGWEPLAGMGQKTAEVMQRWGIEVPGECIS